MLTAIVAVVVLMSCGSPAHQEQEQQSVTSRPIEEVLAAHTDSLMAMPGVVGTAIGLCDGAPCIRVLLSRASDAARQRIPARLEGYPVQVEVTGQIQAR
jgi:hypothetical protein